MPDESMPPQRPTPAQPPPPAGGPPSMPPGPPPYGPPPYGPHGGMSPAPIESRRRPAVVTSAAGLMMLMALVGLGAAGYTLAMMGRFVDRFRELAGGTDATRSEIDDTATFIQVISVVVVFIGIVMALVLVGLALGNLRGSNGSRIATWVVGGLGVLGGCCGLFGAVGQNNAVFVGGGDNTARDLGRALADAVPGWWTGVSGGLSVGQALGYIAVAALLAMPAANAFFRRPAAPPWRPPPAQTYPRYRP